MDRVEVWALVGQTVTKFHFDATEVSSVQMQPEGPTSVKLKGCAYQGKPITDVYFADAEVVFVYMERHNA